MEMIVKESNKKMEPIGVSYEEIEHISKNYKKKRVMNHPQETENPLEYILENPVGLEDELIDMLKG